MPVTTQVALRIDTYSTSIVTLTTSSVVAVIADRTAYNNDGHKQTLAAWARVGVWRHHSAAGGIQYFTPVCAYLILDAHSTQVFNILLTI